MGLENIKVGDRVWQGRFNYRARTWERLNLDEVCAVTVKKFRVKRHPKDLYDKQTGTDYKGAQYVYYAIATPKEIEAWEAAQAQRKQDEENAKAASERLYQEKCERATRLWIELGVIDALRNLGNQLDVISFEFEGHRYHVKEIETNGK